MNDDDMIAALKRLASGKAIGIDGLADRQLKAVLNTKPDIRGKVQLQYDRWLNGDEALPAYLKTARTVYLSEDGTAYPPVG